MNKENHQPEFTGVWIPAEIWDDERITWFDKCLWATVLSLTRRKKKVACSASNGWFAERFGTSVGTVANGISKLRGFGLIKDVGTGDKRLLLAVFDQGIEPGCPSQGSEGGFTSLCDTLHKEVKATAVPNIGIEQSENGKGSHFSKIQTFKAALALRYKRSNSVVWSRKEEELLAVVVKRQEFDKEVAEIKAYRERHPKYFPKSVWRLLDNWDMVLDQARQPEIKSSSEVI